MPLTERDLGNFFLLLFGIVFTVGTTWIAEAVDLSAGLAIVVAFIYFAVATGFAIVGFRKLAETPEETG